VRFNLLFKYITVCLFCQFFHPVDQGEYIKSAIQGLGQLVT